MLRYNTLFKSISKGKSFRRCFTDVEEVFYKKPTGNRTLGIECSYCPYKTNCWKDLEFNDSYQAKEETQSGSGTHITDAWRSDDASV